MTELPRPAWEAVRLANGRHRRRISYWKFGTAYRFFGEVREFGPHWYARGYPLGHPAGLPVDLGRFERRRAAEQAVEDYARKVLA